MCQHAAFFLQPGRTLSGVIGQELYQVVTEEMRIPLAFATEVHGLETSDLKRPIAKIRLRLKLLEFSPHGHARLLHHHLRVIQTGKQRSQERVDPWFVPNEQSHELFVFWRCGRIAHFMAGLWFDGCGQSKLANCYYYVASPTNRPEFFADFRKPFFNRVCSWRRATP